MSGDKKKGFYVSTITRRIASTTGHVIIFEANKPKFVPESVREELLEYGILPVDGDLPITEEGNKEKPVTGTKRIDKIIAALAQIADLNDSNDFTAGGLPTLDAVFKLTGFEVTANERNKYWKQNRKEAATNPE